MMLEGLPEALCVYVCVCVPVHTHAHTHIHLCGWGTNRGDATSPFPLLFQISSLISMPSRGV